MNTNSERKITPITSLEARRRHYWEAAASASGLIGLILVLTIAACLAAVRFLNTPWQVAALVSAVIIAPPIWMLWPNYPTEDDVNRDRAMRRAAGLPDDVER